MIVNEESVVVNEEANLNSRMIDINVQDMRRLRAFARSRLDVTRRDVMLAIKCDKHTAGRLLADAVTLGVMRKEGSVYAWKGE